MLSAREQLSFWLPLLTNWCEGHCTTQQGLQTPFVCPLGLLMLLPCLMQHGDSAATLLKSLRSDLNLLSLPSSILCRQASSLGQQVSQEYI